MLRHRRSSRRRHLGTGEDRAPDVAIGYRSDRSVALVEHDLKQIFCTIYAREYLPERGIRAADEVREFIDRLYGAVFLAGTEWNTVSSASASKRSSAVSMSIERSEGIGSPSVAAG